MERKLRTIVLLLVMMVVVIAYMRNFSQEQRKWKEDITTQGEQAIVVVYSSREGDSVHDLFEKFTEKTGIRVSIFTDNAEEILNKIRREGRYTPVDLFLASDIGSLQQASDELLIKGVRSGVLEGSIPPFLRSRDGEWYGLSKRVRAIFYARDRVTPDQLSTYMDLANPRWKGKILMGPSAGVGNQALIASMIHHYGHLKAIDWLEGMKANFARMPQGDDVAQLRALAAGEGDLTVADSDDYGRLLVSDKAEDREVASKIGMFFPNQDGWGALVNISGGGVVTSTLRTENALKLLEFLVSEEAQNVYAERNYDYPVVVGAEPSDVLKGWGSFKADEENMIKFVQHIPRAREAAQQLKWE